MKKVFFCFHLCQNKVWLICIVTPVVSWVFLSKGFSKEKGQMMEWIQLDTNFYVHSFRMNWQYILPFYFWFVVYSLQNVFYYIWFAVLNTTFFHLFFFAVFSNFYRVMFTFLQTIQTVQYWRRESFNCKKCILTLV